MGKLVLCASCKYSASVPETYAGRRVICPRCGNQIDVPEAPGQPPVQGPSGVEADAGTILCKECSRATRQGAFCTWCGAPLQEPRVTSARPSKKCPFCAEDIPAGVPRCPHCSECLEPTASPTNMGGPDSELRVKALNDRAVAAFVMAMIGLFVCFLGPMAWIMSAGINKELARLGRPANGMATAAMVIGIAITAMWGLFLMCALSVRM